MPWFEDEATATAKGERRAVLVMAGFFMLLSVAHWIMVFASVRPENPFLCSLPRIVLPVLWLTLSGLAGYASRRGQFRENRRFLLATVVLSAVAAGYLGLRADNDIFTLAVRYHLWRAGGIQTVRKAAEGWVKQRQSEQQSPRDTLPFSRYVDGRSVRIPDDELPKPVQHLRKTFPHSFYARMDETSLTFRRIGFDEADIRIYFPAAEPEEDVTLWEWVRGTRRQIGEGITVRIYKSNK